MADARELRNGMHHVLRSMAAGEKSMHIMFFRTEGRAHLFLFGNIKDNVTFVYVADEFICF